MPPRNRDHQNATWDSPIVDRFRIPRLFNRLRINSFHRAEDLDVCSCQSPAKDQESLSPNFPCLWNSDLMFKFLLMTRSRPGRKCRPPPPSVNPDEYISSHRFRPMAIQAGWSSANTYIRLTDALLDFDNLTSCEACHKCISNPKFTPPLLDPSHTRFLTCPFRPL